ncbi:ABC transporter permease [Kocuria sp. p3-SID1433]|uniref:ABC transporter permease n=1 Tax=unclassified Kocuria TaxID=2649579 RepID=UPI0021A2E501|nr:MULTISPECIES: ABC transporter permease [unclassified Kocuria]MCT1600969.1 ABC transporter permease [Kocuria sp. p3-SID1428]MCT2179073.1 ABC transporter permease [Kocuria sp. p3-SID1433]
MPADRTIADAQAPWVQGRGTPSSGPSSSALSAADPDSPDSALAGLDALQSDGRRRRSPGEVFRQRAAPTLAALVAAVLIWQLLVALIDPRPDIMPGPIDVARQIGAATADGTLPGALGTSLWRGISGFLIAVVVATPLGLLIASWQGLRNAVGPLISGMQVLPSVAWVPAAIVWFGLSDATVYFVVLMGAIPSIVNGMLAGVDQIPPQLLKAGRIMGATGSTLALKVVLPAAMPGYAAGLKQGWAFSWRSLMGAELIAIGGSIGFGLGSLLAQGRTVSDMAVVLTAVLSILAVGIVIELLLFNPLEKRLLRGRGLLRS